MSGMRKDNDMRILISNDDGIFAPGLMALVRAFSAAGHTVYVAAPDSQRSAASHSMTLFRPLTARARAVEGAEKAWAIDGTPVDCVKLAVKALCPEVEFVISGVNHGYNAGSDVLYSGTVGAALEAVMNGVPAIAFSARENGNPGAAEAYLPVVLEALLARPAEPGRVWNVNFPDCAAAQCKGVLYGRTPAACSFYDNDYVRTGDALSIRVTNPGPDRCKEGSDIHAVLHGYVSVGAIRSPLF